MHSRIILRRRQQHRAIAHQRNAEEGRVVAEGPEENRVVTSTVLTQMIEEARYLRAVLPKPFLLPCVRRPAF